MGIAIRKRGQPYFANGLFETLNLRYRQERGFHLDWNVELRWFNTDAHDLHERIEKRTDCVSFTDFMALFKTSFGLLLRTLRELPERNQSFVVMFKNRNLRYIVTYAGGRDKQLFIFKTIRDSSWKTHPTDKHFAVVF